MARREPKPPQNVQLLQRRFADAQTQFDQQFQQRMVEYTGEVSGFESRIADYEAQAQAYMDELNDYSQYLNSFFIKPGTNDVQTFVKYGDNYYWADDIAPGFNLKSIDALGSLSGGEFQFVKTGNQQHFYAYQSYEWVPSGKWENQAYTTYQTQYVSEQRMVPILNPKPGQGMYTYETVQVPKTVPVTQYRMTYVDTSKYENVIRSDVADLEIGYLKTQTPEGEFTTMRPEQFAVRSEPAQFSVPPPEAPGGIDISDIKGQLEEEATYLKRETGEMSASARQARMRKRVRPLLAETGEA